MRGLWLEDRKLRYRDDLPVPEPRSGEALVRVLQAGICNTDLEMEDGYYPFAGIPGHEFVGIVEEGPEELRGRRVVGEINLSCGRCPACTRGHPTHCRNRRVLGLIDHHGAFADYLTLPADNLHPIPEALDSDAATFAEPLAAALEIQEQIGLTAEDRVVVVGCGKLGQLVIQSLALVGCRLEAASRRAGRLALPGGGSMAVGRGTELEPGAFDVAIDCTGHPDGFSLARRALRPRGTLVMKSTYRGRLEVDASALVVDEIVVVGSRCGPLGPAVDLLALGRVDPRPIIAARYPLERGVDAFAAARAPGSGKVLLQIAQNQTGEC